MREGRKSTSHSALLSVWVSRLRRILRATGRPPAEVERLCNDPDLLAWFEQGVSQEEAIEFHGKASSRSSPNR